ncbi:hypothetical protein [Lysobacter gummosus]|uniref:hypothetical protein n=1 Tax=Lysobacter gummosus TaxID=262324 RepID=UPI00362C4F9A
MTVWVRIMARALPDEAVAGAACRRCAAFGRRRQAAAARIPPSSHRRKENPAEAGFSFSDTALDQNLY